MHTTHPSRGLRVTAAALGAVAALFISACGSSGGGTSDDTRQKLIDAMVSEGATQENAECLVNELGDDAERPWTTEDADLSDEDTEKFTAAAQKCQ